jgi:hypothetical protein
VKTCQRVSSCQVSGDFCTADSACCGGIPNGSVDCGNTNSRCDYGQSCRAPGTICGKPVDAAGNPILLPDGSVFTVNAETNCCSGVKVNGVEQTCRLDEVGVPRCFGGGSAQCPRGYTGEAGCCIPAGNVCDFADQCCDGSACVPGADGVRRCAAAQTCKELGTTCDPNAGSASGCCAGTACLPASELTHACQVSQSDGGATCRPNGTGSTSACIQNSECCSNVCTNGHCAEPAACQPANATCTASGDCCTGLRCNIPSGSASGTCKVGATCSQAGQTCTPDGAQCCTGQGLRCVDGSGQACTGTNGECSCGFTLG